MSQALGRLWPHEPEGMLRGIRRVKLRWSLEHTQIPYVTLPYHCQQCFVLCSAFELCDVNQTAESAMKVLR